MVVGNVPPTLLVSMPTFTLFATPVCPIPEYATEHATGTSTAENSQETLARTNARRRNSIAAHATPLYRKTGNWRSGISDRD
jgi:hypothetical protein